MNDKTIKPEWRLVHNALHDKKATHLQLGRRSYPIMIHEPTGLRYLDYDNIRFVQQNPRGKSQMGRRAFKGERITWANPFDKSEKAFFIDQSTLFQPVHNAVIALPVLKHEEVQDGRPTEQPAEGEEAGGSSGSVE